MALRAEAATVRRLGRWQDSLLVVLFALFLVLPVTLQVLGVAQTTAQDEMRNLVQRPRFPTTLDAWRNLGSQIDAYVSDRFGLKRYLLAAGNRLNFAMRLLGGGNRVALLGRDDWLFWRNDIEQHSGLQLLSQA